MDTLIGLINNTQYSWVPIVTFEVIVLLFIFGGFIQGWRVSLYYLIIDIIFLIIGVFTLDKIVSLIASTYFSSDTVDLVGYIKSSPAIVPITLFIWLLLARLLSWLIHFFFRKKFRMKKYVPTGTPGKFRVSLGERFLGSLIAGIGSIPFAAFGSNFTTFFSGKTNFSKFNDPLVLGLTFGKFNGISNFTKSIQDILSLLKNDGVTVLTHMFTNGDVNDKDFITKLTENKDAIQNLINSGTMTDVLKFVDESVLDYTKIESVIGNAFATPLSDDLKLSISQEKFDDIKNILISRFGWSSNNVHWDSLKNAFFKI